MDIDCPSCKKLKLNKHISLKKFFWIHKKVVTYYCLNCGHKAVTKLDLSADDYEFELRKRNGTLPKDIKVNRVTEQVDKGI